MNKEEMLITATKLGLLKVVRLLIEDGVDIHIWNDTALINSAENGHSEIYNYLKSQIKD